MIARIYRPAKTAMQSGQARTKAWVLDFEGAAPREVDPLMGWTSSTDTRAQVRLEFDAIEGDELPAVSHDVRRMEIAMTLTNKSFVLATLKRRRELTCRLASPCGEAIQARVLAAARPERFE